MLPNISADVIEKMKVLQPGNCVAFGSAFKIPMICKLEMPNPMPYSTNCNVSGCWEEDPASSPRISPEPVANNYVTEGVSTSSIENQMNAENEPVPKEEETTTAKTFEELQHADNPIPPSNEDFDPMAGMGDISKFG